MRKKEPGPTAAQEVPPAHIPHPADQRVPTCAGCLASWPTEWVRDELWVAVIAGKI
jgi:hypothetical protein